MYETLPVFEAKLEKEGRTIPHLAAADIAAGAVVVVGALLGVSNDIILDTETRDLQIEGCFRVACADDAVIAVGVAVYWNVAAGQVFPAATATAGDLCFGFTYEAVTDDNVGTILVKKVNLVHVAA